MQVSSFATYSIVPPWLLVVRSLLYGVNPAISISASIVEGSR